MQPAQKLLVVDDDPDITQALSIVLESKGYQVTTAESAEAAMQKVHEMPPDLILLDIMMPNATEGFHFVWELRQDADPQAANLPILVVSALHQHTALRLYPDQADSSYGPGEFLPVQGWLDKPVQPSVLLERVAELLAARTESPRPEG